MVKFGNINYSKAKKNSKKGQSLFHNLQKYFSSKTALVQITAGIGALGGRSLASYFGAEAELPILGNVGISHVGSFVGYIGTYFITYQLMFKNELKKRNKSVKKVFSQIQGIEQSGNIPSLIATCLGQYELMANTDLNPIIAANIANFAGYLTPFRIANLIAMVTANSLNKAWVYEAWDPEQIFHPKKVFYMYPKRCIYKLKELAMRLYSII